MAVSVPPVVVLIVCKAILGQPDDNTQFTHHIASEWDMSGGVMHCRRMQVELYDPAPDQGADPQPFSAHHCMQAGARMGAQYDVDNWNKPWRFWRFACPVPIMNAGPDGIEGNRDDRLIGYKIPECPAKDGVLECEGDIEI